ncbi:MAG: DNA-binding response regulator [Deltaproteobacteria bacterium]|nr:DNA-binding response regulator [Deltaproteobacteria bacterium]HCH62073.1 DNA-binding response regulator [Deltaproteobacteria bacterium]
MSDLILIVDDEPDLVSALGFALGREGFRTRGASDGASALREARTSPKPDLVLLDLMLPDIQGTEVCRQLKANSETADIPVIMLTARSAEIDRVVGFEVGADDYVPKPFSTRELALRIRAVLRRSRPRALQLQELSIGCLRVDVAGHQTWVHDQERVLTALEFRLLTTLLQRRGRAQSREALLDEVWGASTAVTTRTVDTHVKRLRQKLGEAGDYIQTIRGVGYKFASSVASTPGE